MATFLLFESASGYALFEGLDMDEIGQTAEAVQETITCVETAAPFSLLLQGQEFANRRPPPARARVRSTKEPDRETTGSLRARAVPSMLRFPGARAASSRQPLVSQRRASTTF